MSAGMLYRSSDIKNCLTRLFEGHTGRRVILVAYIGEDWRSFIAPETVKGMTVICAPSPVTSAIALTQMRAHGAQLFFSPKLHMKVYWADGRGCIIGSANLSRNAMGEEGLKEAAVKLPSEVVQIDRLIAEAEAIPVTEQSLADLAKKNQAMERKAPNIFPRKSRTFIEWYRTEAPVRTPWKLGWWIEEARPSKAAKDEAERLTGKRDIENHLECGRRHYKKGDWVLSFRLPSGAIERGAWLFVDHVAEVRKEGDDSWPCEALQFRHIRHYGKPPFTVDAEFRRAFKSIARAHCDAIESLDNLTPSRRFLVEVFQRLTEKS